MFVCVCTVVCGSGLKRCGVKDLCGGSKGQTRWVDVCKGVCVCARLCVKVDSRDVELKTCVVAKRDRPGGLMCVCFYMCAYLSVPLRVEVDSRDVELKTCVVAQMDRPGGLTCVCVHICVCRCVRRHKGTGQMGCHVCVRVCVY